MFNKLISALILTITLPLFSVITPVESIQELEQVFNSADENTLVVFDIDHVLVVSKDHYIHPNAEKIYFKHVDRQKKKQITKEQKQKFYDTMRLTLTAPERVIVEKETPVMIKQMQDRGIKVVALTALPTDIFGFLYTEKWRVHQLRDLGIDFSVAFPQWNIKMLDAFAHAKDKAPSYYDGIIFSKNFSKGEVLRAFFAESGFYPKKVIFVDDLKENLESVERELIGFDVEIQSYHYNGAKSYYKTVNEQVIEYQVDHLIDNEQWLSDEEVLEKIAA